MCYWVELIYNIILTLQPESHYCTSLYEHLPSKENQYYLNRVVPIINYYLDFLGF